MWKWRMEWFQFSILKGIKHLDQVFGRKRIVGMTPSTLEDDTLKDKHVVNKGEFTACDFLMSYLNRDSFVVTNSSGNVDDLPSS